MKKKAKVSYLENEPKGLNYKHQVLKYIILHGYHVKPRKKTNNSRPHLFAHSQMVPTGKSLWTQCLG